MSKDSKKGQEIDDQAAENKILHLQVAHVLLRHPTVCKIQLLCF